VPWGGVTRLGRPVVFVGGELPRPRRSQGPCRTRERLRDTPRAGSGAAPRELTTCPGPAPTAGPLARRPAAGALVRPSATAARAFLPEERAPPTGTVSRTIAPRASTSTSTRAVGGTRPS